MQKESQPREWIRAHYIQGNEKWLMCQEDGGKSIKWNGEQIDPLNHAKEFGHFSNNRGSL